MREYHVALRSHDAAGVQFVNTFGVKADPTGVDLVEATAQEVADGIAAWLATTYRAILATAYTWDDVMVRQLDAPVEATHGVSLAGTLDFVSGGPLPKECTLILALKTEQATRSGRGYMALPSPLNSSTISDSTSWQTSGTYWGNVANFGASLLAGHDIDATEALPNGQHLSARVISRKLGVTYDVTNYVRRPYVRWRQSRQTAP